MVHRYLLTDNAAFWLVIGLIYIIFNHIIDFMSKKNPPFLKVCIRIKTCTKVLILIELTYRIAYDFIHYVFK